MFEHCAAVLTPPGGGTITESPIGLQERTVRRWCSVHRAQRGCSDFNSGSAAAKLASAAHCDGKFNRCDVRIATESPPVPFLSAVVVRWGGATTEFAEQWGAISSSVSDKYIDAFLDTAYSCLGPRYEVLSVFVESGADLSRLQLGSLAGRLRGNHRCACYFLWPTLAQVIR